MIMQFKLSTNIFFFVLILSIQSACQHTEDNPVTSCIDDIIDTIKSEPVRNPPAIVSKWVYEGETYYFIPADCCDNYSELYDSNCNLICAPDGGITGAGDGTCPDFIYHDNDNISKTVYWSDPRN